jgi:mannitol-specific phosphotransferase system IIBC component
MRGRGILRVLEAGFLSRLLRVNARLWLRGLAGLALAAGICFVAPGPLRAQQVSVAQHQKQSNKEAAKQDKARKKAAKNQAKAQKKAQKAQAKQLKKDRKSDAKANRQLHGGA